MIIIYLIGFFAGVTLFGFGKYIKKFEAKLFLWVVMLVCCLIGGVYSCTTTKHGEWDRYDNYSIKP